MKIALYAVAGGLLLAACGSSGKGYGSSSATTAPTAAAASPTTAAGSSDPYGSAGAGNATASTAAPATTAPAAAPASAGNGSLQLATTKLGKVLADGTGMTVYLFTKDSPGVSACYDACAKAWPAVGAVATLGDGLDKAKLGTITRRDGTTQVTYGGWPLYHYAKDAQPGDVNGEKVGGVWFAVAPTGQAA